MNLWHYDSPLGQMLLAEEAGALVGLWFSGQKHYPESIIGEYRETPAISQAESWLDRYFAGQSPDPRELKLNPQGSEFRREVWELLLEIPYGKTTTYGELAGKIAKKRGLSHMSAQAVGGAVGSNPISVIIPCHRVLGADGSLTGYAGGLERKQFLLRLEGDNTK